MVGETPDQVYTIADDRIEVFSEERVVICDGQPLETITPDQFDILATLASKPDNIFTWGLLSLAMWQRESDAQTRVNTRVQVYKLRGQLGHELGDLKKGAIRAKSGLGYYAVSSLTGSLEISNQHESKSTQYAMADGRLVIHSDKWIVTLDGVIADVTPIEYRILNKMARQPDSPISVPTLCRYIWGIDNADNRTNLRVFIKKLRLRLGDELGHKNQGIIRNDFGKGYYVVSSLNHDPVRDNGSR